MQAPTQSLHSALLNFQFNVTEKPFGLVTHDPRSPNFYMANGVLIEDLNLVSEAIPFIEQHDFVKSCAIVSDAPIFGKEDKNLLMTLSAEKAQVDANYGSRVTSGSWGCWDVVTTGYGDLTNKHNARYTAKYSGTSAANPIVAGATASLSGIAKAYGISLTPKALRSLLTETGTPIGSYDRYIGTQPNLRTAIDKLLENYVWVNNFSYYYSAGRVDFGFSEVNFNTRDFLVKLTHNGKYVASCENGKCYYSSYSKSNGAVNVRKNLNLKMGDRLAITVYGSNNRVVHFEEKIVAPTFSNFTYNYFAGSVDFSFNNNYLKDNDFFIKLLHNGRYAAECRKGKCYYLRSSVKNGVRHLYYRRGLDLKFGDRLTLAAYDTNNKIISRQDIVVTSKFNNFTYDLSSKRVSFDFANGYLRDDNFSVKLLHNGRYAAECKKGTCYYISSSVSNGVRSLTYRRASNLKVGDSLTLVAYGANNKVLSRQDIVVTQ